MRTFIHGRAIRTALFVAVSALAASACSAQDNARAASPARTFTGGQGGYVVIPDTTPAPPSYALTGEKSQSQQALSDWRHEAGPVFSYGNARIVIPSR